MTERGKYQVFWASRFLRAAGYDTAALDAAGKMMGPCYFFAWEAFPGGRYPQIGKDLRPPLGSDQRRGAEHRRVLHWSRSGHRPGENPGRTRRD
ncbi:MAG: hypothetical protein HC902_06525 [Calothrix sp. SM1_5_4]|nr:hypothetical protein [Calothrix sp. SM1_5_4]